MSDKKPKSLETVKQLGYVCLWANGDLGWCSPPHINNNRSPCPAHVTEASKGEWAYLCEITLKPVYRKGKLVRRRIK